MLILKRLFSIIIFLFSFVVLTALAQTKTIKMYETAIKGKGKYVGSVTFKDTQYGLLITPDLMGLSPGLHGFHVHQHPSCDNQGLAAGGHFDPKDTHKHLGPYNDKGHLGDLPVLYVDKDGQAEVPILAPRLSVKDLPGHALIIHVDGDNYSDIPKKLGGGGARMACGVIK